MSGGNGIGSDVQPAELVSTPTSVTVSKRSLTYVRSRNPSRRPWRSPPVSNRTDSLNKIVTATVAGCAQTARKYDKDVRMCRSRACRPATPKSPRLNRFRLKVDDMSPRRSRCRAVAGCRRRRADPYSESPEKSQWIHANRALRVPTSTAVTFGFSKIRYSGAPKLSVGF